MPDTVAVGRARLLNPTGLHARPSVKLTQLAKSFSAYVEIATSPDGPWVDAKSPVKVMGFQAEAGALLHFRVTGEQAARAVAALISLVECNFGEHAQPQEEKGRNNGRHHERRRS